MAEGTRKGFTFSDAPPPEVSAYLRQKGDRPAFRWTEVWGQEHAHAFTVAKAVEADILSTIRESLQYAIDKGIPFDSWSRDLKPELQRLGWWGEVAMADPATGEIADRELGSPRRLRTIYQANLRSARAAGQYDRAQRTKTVLPFWVYGLGPSEKHRVEHVAKEGVVLPVDDPFWDAWFPPNGWGCKCWLRQITRAEAMRRGISAPIDVPTKTFSRTRDDGRVERVAVPVGIDPGWQTSPGQARTRTLMTNMADRLAKAGEPAARALMSDIWESSTADAFAKLPGRFFAPAAATPKTVMDELGSTAPIIMISSDTLAIKLDKHGKGSRGLRPADIGRIQTVLDQGRLVQRIENSALYIHEFEDGWYRLAIKRTALNEIVVSSFSPMEPRAAKVALKKGR